MDAHGAASDLGAQLDEFAVDRNSCAGLLSTRSADSVLPSADVTRCETLLPASAMRWQSAAIRCDRKSPSFQLLASSSSQLVLRAASYPRSASATPAISSAAPATRIRLIGCCATPSRPK